MHNVFVKVAPMKKGDVVDYDRRPMHLQIPRSLALDYLLKPGSFKDGQLCIGVHAQDVREAQRPARVLGQAVGGVVVWCRGKTRRQKLIAQTEYRPSARMVI